MRKIGLAGLLVLSTATGSLAAAPEEKAQTNKNGKICQTEETLGSRLGKRRVCRTPEEWKAIAEEAKRASEEVSQKGMTTGSPFNGG